MLLFGGFVQQWNFRVTQGQLERVKTDWENTLSQRFGLLVASQGESAEWIYVMMQTVWRPVITPLMEQVRSQE